MLAEADPAQVQSEAGHHEEDPEERADWVTGASLPLSLLGRAPSGVGKTVLPAKVVMYGEDQAERDGSPIDASDKVSAAAPRRATTVRSRWRPTRNMKMN